MENIELDLCLDKNLCPAKLPILGASHGFLPNPSLDPMFSRVYMFFLPTILTNIRSGRWRPT